MIGADGVGRGEYVRLVHRTFPGLAAARNTKLLHESQGLLTRGGRRRVAGDPGVTQQGGRAIGARSQDRVAGPTQLCLLSVSRLVNPAPLRPLSLYEILDLALHAGQRLRQITVKKREFPLQDVAIGLRRERPRPAVAQHVSRGEFDPVAHRLFRHLRVEPEKRREPRRMTARPTDAMTPTLGFSVPDGFQQPVATDIQFALKRARPGVRFRQTAGVLQVLAQNDAGRAGLGDDTGVEGHSLVGR